MEKTNPVLLIFNDFQELEFTALNLSRNGFRILKSQSLTNALISMENINPDLIVIKTADAEKDIEQFENHFKIDYSKKTILPWVIKLED